MVCLILHCLSFLRKVIDHWEVIQVATTAKDAVVYITLMNDILWIFLHVATFKAVWFQSEDILKIINSPTCSNAFGSPGNITKIVGHTKCGKFGLLMQMRNAIY